MLVCVFLCVLGLPVIFSQTYPPITCTKPEYIYNIVLKSGNRIAIAQNTTSNPYNGVATICARFMSENPPDKDLVISIPVDAPEKKQSILTVGINRFGMFFFTGYRSNVIYDTWNTTTWTHRCFIYNGTAVTFYKDGMFLATQKALPDKLIVNRHYRGPISVGDLSTSPNKSAFNYLSYYDRVLSSKEVEGDACNTSLVLGNHLNMRKETWCWATFENVTGKEFEYCNKNSEETNKCTKKYGNGYVNAICKTVDAAVNTVKNTINKFTSWLRIG